MFRLTVFFLGFLAATCSGASQLDCPDLYDIFIYDLCYRIYTTPANYTEAKDNCNIHNRPLAVLHNGYQGSYLASYVNAQTGVNNGAFWIGLQRASNTSKFYWDDGSAMHWNFWNFGYPNGFNQVGVSTLNRRWMTLDESEKHVYACSYDPSQKPITTVSTTLETTTTPSTPAPTTSTVVPTAAPTNAPTTVVQAETTSA
ncbi:unnamed protein product [Caenorhabditis angaria]|uniref:C-type lectin domain-containing protein n=1 Tax=Caenorhabditis angaria TaxID=860376 RepID=A0A9P1IWW3_9PELO|nr:unnamed protein product [Caenorhabditis angaria]